MRWLAALCLLLMGCEREVETAPLPSALPVPRPPPDACSGATESECAPHDGLYCQPVYYGGRTSCSETHYLDCRHIKGFLCDSDLDCAVGSQCREFLSPLCPIVEVGPFCDACSMETLKACLSDAQYAIVPHPEGS